MTVVKGLVFAQHPDLQCCWGQQLGLAVLQGHWQCALALEGHSVQQGLEHGAGGCGQQGPGLPDEACLGRQLRQ